MRTERWRIELVEEIAELPVPWQPLPVWPEATELPGEIAKAALMTAFDLLAHRGTGPLAWAASFRHDPIAFLLDTSSDAINVWGSRGELLYRNRAAERLGLGRSEEAAREDVTAGDRRLERRCCRFRCGHAEYLLEIIGQGAE